MDNKKKERLFVTPESVTAQEIKEIRKKLQFTQAEFAQLVGCSKPTVERWERSKEFLDYARPFIDEDEIKITLGNKFIQKK